MTEYCKTFRGGNSFQIYSSSLGSVEGCVQVQNKHSHVLEDR